MTRARDDNANVDAVALDLTKREFSDQFARIREAEQILGSEEKKVNDSEHQKYFKEAR